MLTELRIENLQLIELAEVEFSSGWISVTGESGAGKSILLGALKIATGAKVSADMIRQGASSARIETIFDLKGQKSILSWLENKEIDVQDDELILSREILSTGKSRIRLNGVLINQGELQEIGSSLIQFHGQSEQVLLKDLKSHEILLDSYAESQDLLLTYKENLSRFRKAQAHIADLEQKRQKAESEQDFLSFQYKKLNDPNLVAGEEEELEAKVKLGAKSGLLATGRAECEDLISDSKNALVPQLRLLKKKLESLSRDFPLLEASLAEMDQIESILENTSDRLSSLSHDSEISPFELDQMNERLAQIQRLKREFRTDLSGLIALREQRKSELQLITGFDDLLAEAQLDLTEAQRKLDQSAQELSAHRKLKAAELSTETNAFLQKMAMPCDFEVEILAKTEVNPYGPTGVDLVEFFVTPNKGEGRRPLRASLSGGELSRIMLALKSSLAGRDGVPTLIFDEVDTGVSGETSYAIARCLKHLSAYHQLINITHLQQVASKSNQQLLVLKSTLNDRTQTQVKSLNAEERILEIARMMGGTDNAHALAHAQTLLQEGLS